ncbi:MAG TPA: thiamine phosphate synthase [Terriglobales bacterium]
MELILYYITDHRQIGPEGQNSIEALLAHIKLAAQSGIDFIQVREKELSTRALEKLVREAVRIVREYSQQRHPTRLLVNSRMDVAIAAGADGVHLRADDLPASEARTILSKAGITRPVVSVSCHTIEEVAAAEAHGADFAVYGPVFGKGPQPGTGIEGLRAVCNRAHAASPKMPVLALGGITLENAGQCIEAGAAGIAAIRLFQQKNVREAALALRPEKTRKGM